MSDNWAVCPRCVKRAWKASEQERAAVQASYGKVTAEEYATALAAIPEEPAQLDETFREDYEIYGARTGTVTVDYSGNCQECGLSLSFTLNEPIEGIDD